ncbi:hypothetical protein L2E82_22607 [Cichorium intybus]|uniref:Uncharacterized protein n=1 Tax=Cichorium intybus TaxID=13427 RepID=A0ACB9DY12_CICIN|nr:hypothetical protein L2E82_22607 [Cichorium intybus]
MTIPYLWKANRRRLSRFIVTLKPLLGWTNPPLLENLIVRRPNAYTETSINEEGFCNIQEKYLGGLYIVIKFKDPNDARTFLQNRESWMRWFKMLEYAEYIDLLFERLTVLLEKLEFYQELELKSTSSVDSSDVDDDGNGTEMEDGEENVDEHEWRSIPMTEVCPQMEDESLRTNNIDVPNKQGDDTVPRFPGCSPMQPNGPSLCEPHEAGVTGPLFDNNKISGLTTSKRRRIDSRNMRFNTYMRPISTSDHHSGSTASIPSIDLNRDFSQISHSNSEKHGDNDGTEASSSLSSYL